MKKTLVAMAMAAATTFAAAGAAQASTITLGAIKTNNCSRAASEVRLLRKADIAVDAECIDGEFAAANGQIYDFKVVTQVSTAFEVSVGDAVELNGIDTDNCAAAQSEIMLLQSPAVEVDAYCEAGTFYGLNGRIYPFKLRTTIRVLDASALAW